MRDAKVVAEEFFPVVGKMEDPPRNESFDIYAGGFPGGLCVDAGLTKEDADTVAEQYRAMLTALILRSREEVREEAAKVVGRERDCYTDGGSIRAALTDAIRIIRSLPLGGGA